jgi:hypothetical protein
MTVWLFTALMFAWASGANAGVAVYEPRRPFTVFSVLYLLCTALMVWRIVTP